MPAVNRGSPWQTHKLKWFDCRRCSLCDGRSQVVLARGKVPSEILLIGEAPGESEDVLGRPFCGPAGHLLDSILTRAVGDRHTMCFTNLVACIPRGEDGTKTREPPVEAIRTCSERLREIIALCHPGLVVYVGKLAAKHAHQWVECASIEVTHPAAILRADVAQQGIAVQRCIVAIQDAVEDVFG